MDTIELRNSRFVDYGNINFAEGEGGILLKKRYSSVIYCPQPGEKEPGAMYPRAVCLAHNGNKNGTLLATFECYTHGTPVFPIYESTDGARSWRRVGQVEDLVKGHGCRYQPHLYELPARCGGLEEGTILCAGNMIPGGLKETALHLYQSTDLGRTWQYRSEIAAGGEALVDIPGIPEQDRPVWEPFLEMTESGDLICFYSDERFSQSLHYNQLLAHKISHDGGLTWEEAVTDVAFPDGMLRPGMPVIARTAAGSFMMVYEMINEDGVPVYYRMSRSIEDWGEKDFTGHRICTRDGSGLTGTPYVTWIPGGGPEGTFLATGRGFSHILANSSGGRGYWDKMERLIEVDNTCMSAGYSQCVVPMGGGRQILNLCSRQISPGLSMIEAAVADVYVKA